MRGRHRLLHIGAVCQRHLRSDRTRGRVGHRLRALAVTSGGRAVDVMTDMLALHSGYMCNEVDCSHYPEVTPDNS